MTREQAKELLPVIQEFAEGKIIQCKIHNETEWFDIGKDDKASFNTKLCDYRIKPETKYRPFKTQEECWQEMQKHQPFGWIIYRKIYHNICDIDSDGITILYACDPCYFVFKTCIKDMVFADGTLFGVKEE